MLLDQAQEQEIRFRLIMFIDKNHFKKEKYETTFLGNILNPTILSEIFYCDMKGSETRIRMFSYNSSTQEPF